jgi:hypothetical protein
VDDAVLAAEAALNAPVEAQLALPHMAGPPLVTFPDGSTMTGAEAERYRLEPKPVDPLGIVPGAQAAVDAPLTPDEQAQVEGVFKNGVIDARRTAHYDPAVADLQSPGAPEPGAIEIPGKSAPGAGLPSRPTTTQQQFADALEKQSRGELLSSYERVLLDNPPEDRSSRWSSRARKAPSG